MDKKYKQTTFDLSNIQETIAQVREARVQAKEEYKTLKSEGSIKPLKFGQKVILFFVIIFIIAIIGLIVYSNLDLMFYLQMYSSLTLPSSCSVKVSFRVSLQL